MEDTPFKLKGGQNMEHIDFQASQTAAVYVAGGLDENTQEAFEIHLMDCTRCNEDVEAWRAIKLEMPKRCSETKKRTEVRTGTLGRRFVINEWQIAASLVGVGVIGAAGGWLGRATISSGVDPTQTVVFHLPAVSRGAGECTPIRLGADTRCLGPCGGSAS
jgi:anti-sigma factor RsiW